MSRRLATVFAAAISMLTAGLIVPATPAVAAPKAADPVVIVAGTFGPAIFYEPLAARMRADGYQVSIFQLTDLGTGDIAVTARDLGDFVAGVRADTGAAKVDLVGHSQGGLVARQYVKFNDGESSVDSVISLGAPHYGTTIANIADFFGGGDCAGIVACQQMATGSDFVNALNEGDDTVGSINYTNIYTSLDELVRPVENAALEDGAANVRVQSQCPVRVVAHIGLATDGTVYDGVRDALAGAPIELNCIAV